MRNSVFLAIAALIAAAMPASASWRAANAEVEAAAKTPRVAAALAATERMDRAVHADTRCTTTLHPHRPVDHCSGISCIDCNIAMHNRSSADVPKRLRAPSVFDVRRRRNLFFIRDTGDCGICSRLVASDKRQPESFPPHPPEQANR